MLVIDDRTKQVAQRPPNTQAISICDMRGDICDTSIFVHMPYAGLVLDFDESDTSDNASNSDGNVTFLSCNVSASAKSGDHTEKLQAALPHSDVEKAKLVEKALADIASHGLNVPLILELMSWSSSACTASQIIKTACTELMHYDRLDILLTTWHIPPKPPLGGLRPAGARNILEAWAFKCVEDIIDDEINHNIALLLRPSSPHVSAKSLIDIDLKDIALKMVSRAKHTWNLMRHMVYTRRQEKQNKFKDPSGVSPFNFCINI